MLKNKLTGIDGRGYKAYKSIKGSYRIGEFTLYVDHVQGDPFAAPSRLRVRLENARAGFPEFFLKNRERKRAAEDFITRSFFGSIKKYSSGRRGTGKSGKFFVDSPGQEIIERTSCELNERFVEMRFEGGLPARGRRVLGRDAVEMFYKELPRAVSDSLFYGSLDSDDMKAYAECCEIQHLMRQELAGNGLIAFIGDGSILPRESGISDRPLDKDVAVAFVSPDSLRIELDVPGYGKVSGMGIKKGITLIAGGGYHGKSTLLDAVSKGIYDHIPGDGRERVVTVPSAAAVRSEDGRYIEKVDISPFINNLPHLKDTTSFSSENASGSTSQAASIVEFLEMGAETLLVDEDTSATNFMIRDERMQELISKDKEPITPFIDKIKLLSEEMGVSTILVMGGSGDYFDVADTVIAMDSYLPVDVSDMAFSIAREHFTGRKPEGGDRFGAIVPRIPDPGSIDPAKGKKPVKIRANSTGSIGFGRYDIDISAVTQFSGRSQVNAAADIIVYCLKRGYIDGKSTIREILMKVEDDMDREGLEVIAPYLHGNHVRPRPIETAALLNRLRSLRCSHKTTSTDTG